MTVHTLAKALSGALALARGAQAGCALLYKQCGGLGYTGPVCCVEGSFCLHLNEYWSGCKPTTPTPTTTPPAPTGNLIRVTFDGPLEPYSEDRATHDFGGRKALYLEGLVEGRGVVTADVSSPKNPFLRVQYPQGCVGPNECGVQMKFPLGASSEELWVSFKVRFEHGFRFVKGGKLPGICGGTCPTGGAAVTGYNGFSARHMWRRDGAGEVYAYVPVKATIFGADYIFAVNNVPQNFTAGRWHSVTTRVKMNTGGRANGVLVSFLDGVNVLKNSSMQYSDRQRQLL